jgi:hypothetical protein
VPSPRDLYTVPASQVDYDLVREFVLSAEAANLFTESLTFEAKEKRSGSNVAEAVAALSNSDGGIVLVGVKDKGATGADRIVGVPPGEHDALVGSLHSYIPEAIPEVIPVAMPGEQRLLLVLRIDADAVPHPVVVSGRVMYRVPGMSVPADRRRVLELAARDVATAQDTERGRLHAIQIYPSIMTVDLWEDDPPPEFDPERKPDHGHVEYVGQVRVGGGLLLPRRALDRPWLDLSAREAAQAAFESSPLCLAPGWSLPFFSTVEARVGHLRFRTPPTPPGPGAYRVQCAADIRVVHRELQMAAALRWARAHTSVGSDGLMSLEGIYHAVLGGLITVASTCRRIAQATGVAEPAEPITWECLLHASSMDFSEIDFGVAAPNVFHHIPTARVPVSDVRELDQLARDWLTYYLLDRDARGFEQQLAVLVLPDSFHVPDLP